MNYYKADFHVHSVLSPCASLDMSPTGIIAKAKAEGIEVLSVTDHNSTRHSRLMAELGAEENIFIVPGVEVNTKEEIHCLAFFEDIDKTELFQKYIGIHLPAMKSKSKVFGAQYIVDRNENILEEVEDMLITALDVSIDEIENEVHRLGGLFVPAHIDRKSYSILSSIGFVPEGLKVDAVEVSWQSSGAFSAIKKYGLVRGSDAHDIQTIGKGYTILKMNQLSFDEIRMAFHHEKGRNTKIYPQ